VRQGLAAGAVRFYWVRSVDASGNKSAWVGGTSATASAVDIPAGTITSTQIADDAITTPKLAANSITADKVGTNEIIATSANIANGVITAAKIMDLQVGTAKIADLNVTTLKIADNAVTLQVSAETSGSILVDTAFEAVQSATLVCAGGPVVINAALTFLAGAHPDSLIQFRLKRGATVISLSESMFVGSNAASFHRMAIDTPGAGSFTYTLEVDLIETGYISNRLIVLQESKK
jgi:hypothetical protein